MSEDWKSDKAEAAMREGTEAIRKAAELRANLEIEKSWDELKNSLSENRPEFKDQINLVIDLLKINYELPEKRD